MKNIIDFINEAQAKGLTVSLKKDIDSYLRGMNTSDLKVLRDGWKEGDGNAAYDKMMHEMDMYLFGGVPGQFDRYKKIISSYIYGKILDRVGVNEAKKDDLNLEDVLYAIEKGSPDIKWYKELRHNSVDDVLEYYTIYYALERDLGVDEDTIRDFVAAHEDELADALNDL